MASTTLFAPSIRAVQPAFIYSNGSGTCTVYFTLNYNATDDVKGIRYTLIDPNKSAVNGLNSMVQTNSYHQTNETSPSSETIYYTKSGNVYTQVTSPLPAFEDGVTYYIKGGNYLYPSYDLDATKTEQSFNIPFDLIEFKTLTVNQFYQIQIELKDSSGNWSIASQTSLIRPILQPVPGNATVSGQKLAGSISYVGGSTVETIASYSYTIKQGNVIVKDDSSKITNLLGLRFETEITDFIFEEGETYSIEINYTTKHGYSPTTPITVTHRVPSTSTSSLGAEVESNIEAGSIKIDTDISDQVSVYRSARRTGYKLWESLGAVPPGTGFSDFTVEGNEAYKYRVGTAAVEGYIKVTNPNVADLGKGLYYTYNSNNQSFNEATESSLVANTVYYIKNNELSCPFEDIFLLGFDTMLAIRYNPKISSLKWVTQDSVTNTLGGRFPLVRRNGDTYYRQFSLSGMLYLDYNPSDSSWACSTPSITTNPFRGEESSLYFTQAKADTYNDKWAPDHLRELAMRFLTDGQLKLFRSTEEGNMIVALTGVSFTPNTTSGRRVYDFSATVTEICEATVANINKYILTSSTLPIYINTNELWG